jgi:hypothetical protein
MRGITLNLLRIRVHVALDLPLIISKQHDVLLRRVIRGALGKFAGSQGTTITTKERTCR